MSLAACPAQPDPIGEATGALLVQELCPAPSARQAYTWESPVHANKAK